MPTSLNVKPIVDLPEWRPLAVSANASAAGTSLISDLRNTEDRHPEIFLLAANTVLNGYHVKNDGWSLIGSPALSGTFAAGAGGIYAPSHGARGNITAGATTTKITASASIGATVGLNQLAGRGDKRGYRIRIIDNGAGGSGKTEEKLIIGNTNSVTPTITLDSALTFTPVTGSTFEILSGRAYLLGAGTTIAAGAWKWYDPALNIFSGNLSITNLAGGIVTDSNFVALDELYVPYTNLPGEGFIVGTATYNNALHRCLQATAISSTTITGQATGGDVAVAANEYRNFQIRIVEDVTNPTAVGQRRRIASHTAGASAVYTVTAWSVTPSATCKFVIENNNDILLWTSGQLVTYSYAANTIAGGQTADTWSASAYATRGASMGVGCSSFQAFGMLLDVDKNLRYSQIYSFRGGGTTTLDILDIAGSATGAWATAVNYGNIGTPFGAGTSLVYDPVGIAPIAGDNDGRGCAAYLNVNALQSFYRFNAYSRNVNQWAQLRYAQGTAVVGQKMAMTTYIDATDNTRFSFLLTQRSTGVEMFQILLQR